MCKESLLWEHMYNVKVSKWHALREIEYDIYIYM
jgi:hypothetical protein